MADWKKEKCEYLRDFLQDNVVKHFENYTVLLPGFEENRDIFSLKNARSMIRSNTAALRDRVQEAWLENAGDVFMIEGDGKEEKVDIRANFLKQIFHPDTPDNVIKIGDIFREGVRGKNKYVVVGFSTNDEGRQMVILKTRNGRFQTFDSNEPDLEDKITRP